jgi:hypothetical protein
VSGWARDLTARAPMLVRISSRPRLTRGIRDEGQTSVLQVFTMRMRVSARTYMISSGGRRGACEEASRMRCPPACQSESERPVDEAVVSRAFMALCEVVHQGDLKHHHCCSASCFYVEPAVSYLIDATR